MATITFEYGKPKRDDSRSVTMVIRNAGTRHRVNTGITLCRGDYRTDKKGNIRITNNSVVYDLEGMRSELMRKITDILRDTICVRFTAERLYELAARPKRRDVLSMDYVAYARRYIDNVHRRTKGKLTCAINSLIRYRGSDVVTFGDFDYSFVRGYYDSMNNTPVARNTYIGIIKRIWEEACLEYNDDNDIVLSPMLFNKIHVERVYSKARRVMTVEEIRTFFSYSFRRKSHILARDMAYLSFCLMGTNLVDIYGLRNYDNGSISYERSKTRDKRSDRAHISIDVHKCVKDVLGKYIDENRKDGEPLLLISAKHSNYRNFYCSVHDAIVQMGKMLDMDGITFYSFRHSFATIARNDVGIAKSDIDEMLNHVGGYRMADVYIRRDFRIINEANKKVLDYVFGEKNNK